jgi:hypothetical protein
MRRLAEERPIPGTVLVEAPPIEIGEVLKNERPIDAVERLRHRLRELDADAHRIRSSLFPAADVKAKQSRDR